MILTTRCSFPRSQTGWGTTRKRRWRRRSPRGFKRREYTVSTRSEDGFSFSPLSGETHEDDGEVHGAGGTGPGDGSGLRDGRRMHFQRQHVLATMTPAGEKAPASIALLADTHLALDEVSRGLDSGLGPDVGDGSDTDGGEAGDGRESLHFEEKRVL